VLHPASLKRPQAQCFTASLTRKSEAVKRLVAGKPEGMAIVRHGSTALAGRQSALGTASSPQGRAQGPIAASEALARGRGASLARASESAGEAPSGQRREKGCFTFQRAKSSTDQAPPPIENRCAERSGLEHTFWIETESGRDEPLRNRNEPRQTGSDRDPLLQATADGQAMEAIEGGSPVRVWAQHASEEPTANEALRVPWLASNEAAGAQIILAPDRRAPWATIGMIPTVATVAETRTGVAVTTMISATGPDDSNAGQCE
jgi:hypothetical protein